MSEDAGRKRGTGWEESHEKCDLRSNESAESATEVTSSLTLRVGVWPELRGATWPLNDTRAQQSNIYNGCLSLDLHQRDDLSTTRAGADRCDRIPAFSAFEV